MTSPGTALVRPPGPRVVDGLVTHVDRQPVDAALARRQWDAYVEALTTHGWEVREVPAADDCPDAVFVEDAVVVFGDLAVVTRPGAPERRAETAGAEEVVSALGLQVVHLTSPATLDGGDVLKVGRTVYVGQGGRTNGHGVAQLRAHVGPRGWTVVPVPVTRVLHLKSAVTALPDGTVIGYPPVVDDASVFPAFREVPEETGSHVVLLGEDRLLLAADAPRTADLLASWGWTPVPVDVGEFAKLEGCVTCLSVRVRTTGG